MNNLQRVVLYVQNIKCKGCASQIRAKLSKIQHIENITVDVLAGKVTFEYNLRSDMERAMKLLQKMGYPLMEDENLWRVRAKSYASCMIGRAKSAGKMI